jgi:hypothetical protein
MPRSKLGYLLFDLPSDHEVESSLTTECEMIETIIHNLSMPTRVKRICVASTERFRKYPRYRLNVQFVHLAGHGSKKGVEMLGGKLKWAEVAKQVKRHLHKLLDGEKRVMVFSCCQSKEGFEATRNSLTGYFTGAYYFEQKRIAFSDAIAVWAMFYAKKRLAKPHARIVAAVNSFMGKEVLGFDAY